MSVKKSPLTRVKEQFGTKEKLVDELVAMPESIIDRHGDKDAFQDRLLAAANTKLLRLHHVGKTVQTRWGSKEGLVEALLALQNRGKDSHYRNKLATQTISRLYDRMTSLERTQKRAQAKA